MVLTLNALNSKFKQIVSMDRYLQSHNLTNQSFNVNDNKIFM